MNEVDELLDLVNDRDEVIGTIFRGDYDRMVREKLGYIRACEMLIQNSEGKFWIPKRTAHKKIAPNGLDYSAGGHVGSGQTYTQAALQEIREELNMELKPEDLEFVKKFSPDSLPYFRALFIYHSDQTPAYNTDDFVSAEWLSLDELDQKLTEGVAAKVSLRETVNELLRVKKEA